jgi:hypothetical protein
VTLNILIISPGPKGLVLCLLERRIMMNHKDLWAKHIKLHIYTANSLKDLSRHNINFQIWRDRTIETLQKAFGVNSDMVERFRKIKFNIPQKLHPDDNNNSDYAKKAYITGIEEAIRLLEECLEQLDGSKKNYSIHF